jgi:DNA replication protein DnaC
MGRPTRRRQAPGDLEAELKRLSLIPLLVVDKVGYIRFDPQAANLIRTSARCTRT